MTIAKTIIYGADDDLAHLLQHGVELNEIDEYGYTPLIQAAIVDSIPKTKLLLDAGADIDFTDLTGRTALFWAADNNNYELCNLLLERGANANAYTVAGQSVLVNPLLRKSNEIKRLLIKNGAKLTFAQDFINAKLLGHRYELAGRVDIVDAQNTFIEVELEGFYLEFSIDVITHSLLDFRWNFGGKHLRPLFPKLDIIVESLQIATELLKYQHYLIDIAKYERKVDQLLNYEPLLIPVIFDGHAISLIKAFDMLVRCDRGEFGRDHGTVIFYQIDKPHMLTKAFIKQLIYKRQFQNFINKGIINHLGLVPKWQLGILPQKAGNCSWANVEAIVPTMMMLLLLEEAGEGGLETCQQEAFDFYRQWREWDKNRALTFCLQSFADDPNEARKAAKATLLAAILFQACKYDNLHDQKKAAKILSVLGNPEYKYILLSYMEVFSKEPHKYQDLLHNLRNYLDDSGISLDA